MKTPLSVLAATLLAGCGGGSGDPLRAMSVASAAGPVTLVREARGSEGGGYDLFLPTRPIPLNGGVWILEAGNDQLVRFDSTLTRATTFARSGEGPGEIEFAMDLLSEGDRLIVAEIGNARLSVFDSSGAFRSVLRTAKSPRYLASVQGRLVTTLDLGAGYTYSVDDRGELAVHADVPEAIARLAASDPRTYLPAGPYIAAGPRDLFVLDPSVLAVAAFDRSGRMTAMRLLPEPFRTGLLQRRLRDRDAWGPRAAAFIDSPAAKRLAIDPQGRLLVLFSLEDAWGLLIDPSAWIARPLRFPEDRRLRDILWAASDASLDGERLYVVSGSQLYQFAVEGW